MKGKSLPPALGAVALLLILTYVGGVQQSRDLVDNRDVYATLSYDDEAFFAYGEDDPRELSLQIDLETKPVDVVLVVDISGTMAAGDVPYGKGYFSRLQIVKRAITAYVMDVIDEKSYITLITFGHDITVSEWQTKNDTISDIQKLEEGGTHSRGADALIKAIDLMVDHERRSELILFTDGIVPETSGGGYLYPDVRPYAEENNVEINVVVVGTERSEELEDLAAHTDGFFIWAKEEGRTKDVESEFEKKYSTHLEDVSVVLKPLGEIEVKGTGGELGTLLRGDARTVVFNVLLKKPQKDVKQSVATLLLSYKSGDEPYEEPFDIGMTIEVQTRFEYIIEQIISTVKEHRYQIGGALISLIALIVAAKYAWVRHKRSQWVLQGDNLFQQGEQAFSLKKYEDAIPLYEKALELYTMAKHKDKQKLCKNSIGECKNTLTTWIQKSSKLDTIIEEIEEKKDQLKTLVGYEPPGRMYEWLFTNVPGIKPLFGPENVVDKAREHVKERDISEMSADILVLSEKRESIKELVSICELNKAGYDNNKRALNDNLAQFMRIDVSYICEFCDVPEVEALFYLNFLIDENAECCTDYDRNRYLEIGQRGEEVPEEPEEVSSELSEEMEQKINFIRHYLQEDVPGIEKLEILRGTIDASEEEMTSMLDALRDADEGRYYIDWYGEKAVVDYVVLTNYIRNAFEKGQNISDIVQAPVNKCTIPKDIQRQIINESQNW